MAQENELVGRQLTQDEKSLFAEIRTLAQRFVAMVKEGIIILQRSKVQDDVLFLATLRTGDSDESVTRYIVLKPNGEIGTASDLDLSDFQGAILVEEAWRVKRFLEKTIASTK